MQKGTNDKFRKQRARVVTLSFYVFLHFSILSFIIKNVFDEFLRNLRITE